MCDGGYCANTKGSTICVGVYPTIIVVSNFTIEYAYRHALAGDVDGLKLRRLTTRFNISTIGEFVGCMFGRTDIGVFKLELGIKDGGEETYI